MKMKLEPTWWYTEENQAYHVFLGDKWIGNIELEDETIVVTKEET
jgi:hypothetical protein